MKNWEEKEIGPYDETNANKLLFVNNVNNENLSNSSSLNELNLDFDLDKNILKIPFNNIELTKDNIKISKLYYTFITFFCPFSNTFLKKSWLVI